MVTTVFRSGNSDAVRLPRHLAMLGRQVRIVPQADGRVILEPVTPREWPPGFFESFGGDAGRFELPPREGPDAIRERRIRRAFREST
jgi:hypothetical protein